MSAYLTQFESKKIEKSNSVFFFAFQVSVNQIVRNLPTSQLYEPANQVNADLIAAMQNQLREARAASLIANN